eukprot:768485-Hanusia_phi.AAC.2
MSDRAQRLQEEERETLLLPLLSDGWATLTARDAINKKFKFKDFRKAFQFMQGVAVHADQLDHHPEWCDVVREEAAGGLTCPWQDERVQHCRHHTHHPRLRWAVEEGHRACCPY